MNPGTSYGGCHAHIHPLCREFKGRVVGQTGLVGAFSERAKSALKTLELNCWNPRQIDIKFGDFGIGNWVKSRVNLDFWYRPVTPGVAGSSPVRSAST